MRPTVCQFNRAVSVMASELGSNHCWSYNGKVWLRLGGDWHLAISPDDAGRFRLEACKRGVTSDTLWCLCKDETRLRALAREAREAATAVAA